MRTALPSRLASTLAILLLIFAGTRALVRALPGDPLETLIAESGTALPVETVRAELGLDRPFLPALVSDLERLGRGDLGRSLLSKQPVAPLLASRFARTLRLAFAALALGIGASLAIGLPAAARPGSAIDRFCSFHGSLMAALPTPWIGPMLMIVFAVWLPVFPVGGGIALPALTLALGISGLWSRLVRERVRETLARGAAVGARARGVPESRVIIKYGLAPAAGALLAFLGTQIGSLLAGAFVTEVLFDWRGMGSMLVDAVLKRDYPVIEAGVFVTAAASLGGALLGDWAQRAFDPRQRSDAG